MSSSKRPGDADQSGAPCLPDSPGDARVLQQDQWSGCRSRSSSDTTNDREGPLTRAGQLGKRSGHTPVGTRYGSQEHKRRARTKTKRNQPVREVLYDRRHRPYRGSRYPSSTECSSSYRMTLSCGWSNERDSTTCPADRPRDGLHAAAGRHHSWSARRGIKR